MKTENLVWFLVICAAAWIVDFYFHPIGMFKEVMVVYSTLALALLTGIKSLLEKILEGMG